MSITNKSATRAAIGTGNGGRTFGAPIVVLTYAHAGGELIARVLSASPAIAFTQGTQLLPFCQAAATTWQKVEGRRDMSALAIKSIRSMVSTMEALIKSRAGATRWCEISYAKPVAAETLLQIFPDTVFLCLHRSLRAVLAEGIASYPWGLGRSPFWSHSSRHAGSSIAIITDYWAQRTQQLLEFEEGHPESCLRVRYEDLMADRHQQAITIFTRLALDTHDFTEPSQLPPKVRPIEGVGPQPAANATSEATPPLTEVSAQMLSKASELQRRLGYGIISEG